MYLSELDTRRLLDIAYQLGGIRDRAGLTAAALELLNDFIGADIALLTRIDVVGGGAELIYHPHPAWYGESLDVLRRLAGEHPLVRHYTTGGALQSRLPLRISDLLAPRRWYHTRVYRELFVLMNARHQLAIPLRTDPADASGYAFNRAGADFEPQAVDRARAAQPVLAALDLAVPGEAPPVDAAAQARERFRLTPREHEVLMLLARGMTARAIARARCLSERTVHRHLAAVYTKLGRHDRLTAVQYARHVGLLQ